jgi:hypothetical protein
MSNTSKDKKLELRSELVRNLEAAEKRFENSEESSIGKFLEAAGRLRNHDANVRREQAMTPVKPLSFKEVMIEIFGL